MFQWATACFIPLQGAWFLLVFRLESLTVLLISEDSCMSLYSAFKAPTKAPPYKLWLTWEPTRITGIFICCFSQVKRISGSEVKDASGLSWLEHGLSDHSTRWSEPRCHCQSSTNDPENSKLCYTCWSKDWTLQLLDRFDWPSWNETFVLD